MPTSQQASSTSNASRIQQLLEKANNSRAPIRQQKQIKAAELLFAEQQSDFALEVIKDIDSNKLALNDYVRYAQIASAIYMQKGKYDEALLIVDAEILINSLHTLPQQQQTELSLLRAELYARTGSHMASAQQRIFIAPLLERPQQTANREAIWRSLMYLPVDELDGYRSRAFSGDFQAWLELALLAKQSQGDLDEQLRQLDSWQQRYPGHPANLTLPGGLELIKELAANRPTQVALLLPLTGRLAPFGKAIRDGFIAAMYETQQRGGTVPKLTIYNTEDTALVGDLYSQAINEGAEMVVGPLEKNRVRLMFDEDIRVPTLALNRIDDYGRAPDKLFQFGLAPQDEAIQIADIAYLENHRQAMIITPRGDWGEKISTAFGDRWQELGGDVMSTSFFSGQQDYSSSIKESLALEASEQRAKRIEQLIGESVEFYPRRRQDIDMILMLARPQQARSIKPLLAFHFAGDIPVYGTSRLYSGYSDPNKDRDINGIRFTDMPWVLESPSTMQQVITEEIPSSKQFQRMYALGIDSYHLHPRLRQLEEIPNSRVYGKTGTLKLNNDRQIERQMLFAKIKRSKATVIPVADQALNTNNTKEGFNYERGATR